MFAIIGLGNPGEKYAHTRHNAGFDVVDILSARLQIPARKLKCQALLGEGMAGQNKVVLIKPQTFMNDSGRCVLEVLHWYKLPPQNVLVVVDDIDLPFGQVRLRAKGGAGTHNGMRSIVQYTATGDFPRVRVGMGKPEESWELVDFVLGRFQTPEDRKIAFDAYQTAADAALKWVESGIEKAMNEYNVKHVE